MYRERQAEQRPRRFCEKLLIRIEEILYGEESIYED